MTFNVVVRDENGEIAFDANSKTNLSVGYVEIPAGTRTAVPRASNETVTVMAHSRTPENWHFAVNEFDLAAGTDAIRPSARNSVAITVRHS